MKGAGSAVCGARTCIAPGSQGQCRPNFFARTNRKNKGTAVEFLKMNDFGRMVWLKELRVQPKLLAIGY